MTMNLKRQLRIVMRLNAFLGLARNAFWLTKHLSDLPGLLDLISEI